MTTTEQSEKIQAARALREQLLRDQHRPGYHFRHPRGHWPARRPQRRVLCERPLPPDVPLRPQGRARVAGAGLLLGAPLQPRPGALAAPSRRYSARRRRRRLLQRRRASSTTTGRHTSRTGDSRSTRGSVEGSGIGIARSRDRHYEQWEKLEIPSLDGTEFGILERTRRGRQSAVPRQRRSEQHLEKGRASTICRPATCRC